MLNDDELVIERIDKMVEEEKKEQDAILQVSQAEKFSKKYEIVVLKGNVFDIQKVNRTTITLKVKRKLKESHSVPDGVYVFTDSNNDVLIPHKVFSKFDNDSKQKG